MLNRGEKVIHVNGIGFFQIRYQVEVTAYNVVDRIGLTEISFIVTISENTHKLRSIIEFIQHNY